MVPMGWVIFPYKPRAANRNLTPLLSFSLTDSPRRTAGHAIGTGAPDQPGDTRAGSSGADRWHSREVDLRRRPAGKVDPEEPAEFNVGMTRRPPPSSSGQPGCRSTCTAWMSSIRWSYLRLRPCDWLSPTAGGSACGRAAAGTAWPVDRRRRSPDHAHESGTLRRPAGARPDRAAERGQTLIDPAAPNMPS
jgi:hypothetical protein